MIPVTLAQVVADCNAISAGEIPPEIAGEQISSLTVDTRTVSAGAVFAAIKGARVNGSELAGAALSAGARAVITAEPAVAVDSGADPARVIAVDDVETAIGALARANLERVRRTGNPDLKVVAVTGSVGKTTVKDLLAALLEERGPIIAPPGSFNNELGLPITVLRADADTATLVLEMGADHVGNIDYLTSIAAPDAAAVLIVARAHLGEFGGIDNVALAKSELVRGTREGGTVVLNADDPRVADMARFARGPVITFSASGRGDVAARDVEVGPDGRASFTLVTPSGEAAVKLRLVGEHHVANALAAAAIAHSLGIATPRIASTLSAIGPASPHRMDVFDTDGVTVIDDSYNANPDSMRAGLTALERLGQGRRKIAVLGEMLELGEASAAEHEAIGVFAASVGVEHLVTMGGEAQPLAAAASGEGLTVAEAAGPEGALTALTAILAPGDVVLLKGSHGSGVWKVADSMREESK
jgi:UDP-N-acetylmuramoyl-tripeptide--D-alanyl-D-alanine ligase